MRRNAAVALLALVTVSAGGGLAGAEPPAVVAFVLDTSGSVGRENLGRAQDLALGVLGSLPAGSEVAVFSFDDQSRLVVPRTSSPAEIQRRIRSLRVAGRFTALHDALYDASRYLRESPATRKAIVLITDGRDENSALNLEDGLRLAQETGIPVYAVGVGTVQDRVLRRIAKLTGGEYVPLSRAKGRSLAGLITALPRSRPAAPAPTSASAEVAPETAPARQGPAESAPAAPPATPTAAPTRAGSRGPLLWGTLGLLAVAAVAVLILVRSQRSGIRCPQCDRALANAFSRCPHCGLAERPRTEGRSPQAPPEEDLSPTVMARMNITEEFLEKTVTLREKPVLSVTRGPGTGQSYDLKGDSSTSIGRAKANDIVVNDVSVSSQHCRIRPENGHFVLHDLKSTNGTYVNERKVERHTLAEGDVIRLGETNLQYRKETSRH